MKKEKAVSLKRRGLYDVREKEGERKECEKRRKKRHSRFKGRGYPTSREERRERGMEKR